MKYFLAILFFIINFTCIGQHLKTPSSSVIYNQLLQLQNGNTVLYIAAHPDDENTRLLAWMANVKNYRTIYTSLTRGDGGQNLIGSEQGEQLGIIRTQELLAARRIDGAEQRFTSAYDFGFSKTSEETLQLWNKEKILSDLVFIIRSTKPDVIIARFPKDKRAGHGHHSASGILADEAFIAAADATKFTEQLKTVSVHKATRMLWNSFNFGTINTTNDNQFKILIGDYNALLGKSVGEIAAESRSMHKSQGFGVPMQRGDITEYFETWGGSAPKNELLDDVASSWDKVPGGHEINILIDSVITNYNYKIPSNSTKILTEIYSKINALNDSWHLKPFKLQQIKNLILNTAGVYIEALSTQNFIAKSDSALINIQIINRGNIVVKITGANLLNEKLTLDAKVLPTNKLITFTKKIVQLNNINTSSPYWLQRPIVNNMFQVATEDIGKPEDRLAYAAKVNLTINNVDFTVNVPIEFKLTDPVKGELLQPLQIINNRKIELEQHVLLTQERKKILLNYDIIDNLNFKLNAGDNLIKGRRTTKNIPIDNSNENKDYTAFLTAAKTEEIINYDHIPLQYFEKISQTKIVKELIKIKGKNIAYINGAGDKVVECLKEMGYSVTILDKEKLIHEPISKYDAIITGVRAYNTNAWLVNAYDKLMQYIFDGGNLIVQYNTNNNLGALKNKLGPYAFDISRNRITEEHAKVTIAIPTHLVFNKPNKIVATDFNNWVQERSIYHAEKFDTTKFIAPILMNDTGEKPDNGSLIIAPYGKGYFVYTGIVFFRQLPAGVAGSYKLLANIIALGKK